MRPRIPAEYTAIRSQATVERLRIGYAGIVLAPLSAIDAAQKRYADAPESRLTPWRSDWLVIGWCEPYPDPIFIDTEDEGFPVYTAIQELGGWFPELLAYRFEHFLETLVELEQLARGRETISLLNENPVPEEEKRSFLDRIKAKGPEVDVSFWKALFQRQEEEEMDEIL